jgi:ferric-dicitrate binding protein FerR (iron transport regulator)
MKLFKIKSIVILLTGLVIIPCPANADNKAVSTAIGSGTAMVSILEGSVQRTKKGAAEAKPLFHGDFLSEGDRVTTGKKSRIELKMPDGSYIRYGESTTFELVSAGYDVQKKKRNISISMILGKAWAKVSRLFSRRGRFSISTKTAVAGVRGTVYRLNVNQDDSVMVKVYWGEVVVNSRKQAQEAIKPGTMMEPTPVSGPHPVEGPHPVSMEEWTYIVKSLQQINIKPDGTVTKPFRFDIKKDLNDWVLWNKQRDETLGDI